VKGEYTSRREAINEAMRLASEHGARQVLAQSNVGKYKRVWPRFSSVRGEPAAESVSATS
jgi:Arc/MetJ-type ribon-helix-helix transcriptional regulator